MCFGAGGGHPGGGQHHRAGDVSAPPAGLALHPMLHMQALQRQEEEEEEAAKEEGLQSTRPLCIVADPAPLCPITRTPCAKWRQRKVKVPKELAGQRRVSCLSSD